MKTKTAEKEVVRNDHMTAQCGHDDQGMCDYCLIAFGEHAEKPGVKSHHMKETKETYTCAECAKAGADTLASRQAARAEQVAEEMTATLFLGVRKSCTERTMKRDRIKQVITLAYEQGIIDGLRDGRGPG